MNHILKVSDVIFWQILKLLEDYVGIVYGFGDFIQLDYSKNHWAPLTMAPESSKIVEICQMSKLIVKIHIHLQYKLHPFQNRSDCFNTAFTTSTEPLGNPIDCPWPPEVHFVSKSLLFHRDHFSQKAARALSWAAGMQPLVTYCYQFSLKCAIYFISFLHNCYQLSTCRLHTCQLLFDYLSTFIISTSDQLTTYQLYSLQNNPIGYHI